MVAEQERVLAELDAELTAAAGALSERRHAAAGRLAGQVERALRSLGMDRAVFEVALEPTAEVGPRGADRVELRLSTNPGEEVKALARVASGGELSRTMLALTSVLARADRVPYADLRRGRRRHRGAGGLGGGATRWPPPPRAGRCCASRTWPRSPRWPTTTCA